MPRGFLLVLLLIPTFAAAATAPDLRSRIHIDGRTNDYASDEFILDATTPFPEASDDSRWGSDNDLSAIALTWDNFNLYVAVPAVVVSTELMVFLDTSCEGYGNLQDTPLFRRNIEFGVMRANVVVRGRRALAHVEAGFRDCETPFILFDPDAFEGVLYQDQADSGAMEVALPWARLGGFVVEPGAVRVPRGQTIRVVSAVTGGLSTGAGDAGPDPTVVLERDSSRVAVLNNHIEVPLDSDRDGVLDMGVSTRNVAVYPASGTEPVPSVLPLQVAASPRAFAPDAGETVSFRIWLNPDDYTLPIYLTSNVYSSSGELIRHLFEEEPRVLSGLGVTEEWDGRDDGGAIVPGGIYVIGVSGGAAPGNAKQTVKAAVSLVR